MALERLTFFVGSTGMLSIRNLKRYDVKPPTLVTDAVVEATMFDSTDTEVVGVSDPISLAAVSGFDGFYLGTVEAAAAVVLGDIGEFVITAISPTAGTRVFHIPWEAKNG